MVLTSVDIATLLGQYVFPIVMCLIMEYYVKDQSDKHREEIMELNKQHQEEIKEIKKRVKFRQHNLLRDPFIKDCDLIVCRNVLIYFTDEAKDKIFQKFYDSLKPGGILFIGSTEQIMNYKEIGFLRKASFFYEKPLT